MLQPSIEKFAREHQFPVLLRLRPENGDRLAVREGKLTIHPGEISQAPVRTVRNLFHGGRNRQEVAQKIEEIARETSQFVKNNIPVKGFATRGYTKEEYTSIAQGCTKEEYTSIAQMQEQVSHLRQITASLGDFYAKEPAKIKPASSSKFHEAVGTFQYAEDYLAFHLSKIRGGNEKLKEISIPHEASPHRPIDLRGIKWHLSSGLNIADLPTEAAQMEKQLVPTWKRVTMRALVIFGMIAGIVPVVVLSGLKIAIWNPIEYAKQGCITTRNPIKWYIEELDRWYCKNYANGSVQTALDWYVKRIIGAELADKEMQEAFQKLAKYVRGPLDLTQKQYEKIGQKELLFVIDAIGVYTKCNDIHVPTAWQNNRAVVDKLNEHRFTLDPSFGTYTRIS